MHLDTFHAGRPGPVDAGEGETWTLTVHDLGVLQVPSGVLGACDPFVDLEHPLRFRVPPGTHRVSVTVADVSPEQDGSHLREAYLSLVLAEGQPASVLGLTPEGAEPVGPGETYAVLVDAGTVAFVDAEAVARCMPPGDWYEELFEPDDAPGWFGAMDDPAHLRAGCANVVMPLATRGENVVLAHSGWGDGAFPVVGTYDKAGQLLGVHLDLLVVDADEDEDEDAGGVEALPEAAPATAEAGPRRPGFWSRLLGR